MQLSAVILARTLAYIERFDLDLRGKAPFAELIKAIGDRYKFQVLPKREEWGEKGLVFEDGKFGNRSIQKLTIFDILIALETRSNTSDSKELIEEMLEWGTAKFGFNYAPGAVKRFAYVSDLSFHSDFPILEQACTPLASIAAKTTAALTEIWGEKIEYQSAILTAGHDPLTRKHQIASFTIMRRSEEKFSTNKYFSEAPLPTDMHIQILEQFENDVRMLGKASVL